MEDCSLPPLTDEVSVLNDLNQMYFRQLVAVRVMVADESLQEMEEGGTIGDGGREGGSKTRLVGRGEDECGGEWQESEGG